MPLPPRRAASSSMPCEGIESDIALTFPQKLMEVLSNQQISDIVSWLPHGKGFIILQKQKFAVDVMPLYFKHSKFTSFTRKLNRWGFTRVSKGPEMGAYYHKYFQRGNHLLCMQMHCNSNNQSSKANRASGKANKDADNSNKDSLKSPVPSPKLSPRPTPSVKSNSPSAASPPEPMSSAPSLEPDIRSRPSPSPSSRLSTPPSLAGLLSAARGAPSSMAANSLGEDAISSFIRQQRDSIASSSPESTSRGQQEILVGGGGGCDWAPGNSGPPLQTFEDFNLPRRPRHDEDAPLAHPAGDASPRGQRPQALAVQRMLGVDTSSSRGHPLAMAKAHIALWSCDDRSLLLALMARTARGGRERAGPGASGPSPGPRGAGAPGVSRGARDAAREQLRRLRDLYQRRGFGKETKGSSRDGLSQGGVAQLREAVRAEGGGAADGREGARGSVRRASAA